VRSAPQLLFEALPKKATMEEAIKLSQQETDVALKALHLLAAAACYSY
jgi:hypothetical protein